MLKILYAGLRISALTWPTKLNSTSSLPCIIILTSSYFNSRGPSFCRFCKFSAPTVSRCAVVERKLLAACCSRSESTVTKDLRLGPTRVRSQETGRSIDDRPFHDYLGPRQPAGWNDGRRVGSRLVGFHFVTDVTPLTCTVLCIEWDYRRLR